MSIIIIINGNYLLGLMCRIYGKDINIPLYNKVGVECKLTCLADSWYCMAGSWYCMAGSWYCVHEMLGTDGGFYVMLVISIGVLWVVVN